MPNRRATQAYGTKVLLVVSDLIQEPLKRDRRREVESVATVKDRRCLCVELLVDHSQSSLAGDLNPLLTVPFLAPVLRVAFVINRCDLLVGDTRCCLTIRHIL